MRCGERYGNLSASCTAGDGVERVFSVESSSDKERSLFETTTKPLEPTGARGLLL